MPVDDRTLAQIALSRAEYDRLVTMQIGRAHV